MPTSLEVRLLADRIEALTYEERLALYHTILGMEIEKRVKDEQDKSTDRA